MAKFSITAPDGKSYNITAPAGATEQDIKSYIEREIAKSAAPKVSRAESFGRGALQGVSLGFSDEIYGAAKGVYDKVLGDGDYSGTYARERDAVRAANDAAQEANPGTYLAGEVGGGVAVPGALARVGFRGVRAANAGLGARTAAAATEGAGYGAAYGLGTGEGEVTDQVVSAANGALVGGAFGAVVPGAVQLATSAARTPVQAYRLLRNPRNIAAEKVSESFSRDAGSEAAGASHVARAMRNLQDQARRGEKNLMLADMGGESVRDLARVAADMPNASNERFRTVLDRRQAVEGRRLSRVLQDTLAGGKEYINSVNTLIKARSDNAGKAFKPAYNSPWTVRGDSDLAKFLTERQYMVRLLDKTRENISGVTGKDPASLSPWEFLHRVKMQINTEIGKAKRGQVDSAANWSIGDLTRLNQEYGRLLAKENPRLGAALRSFSDESGMVNALEEGADDFFKLAPEELGAKISKMARDEADLYRVGAARAQIEKIRQGDVMRDRTKSIYGSDDIGLRLKAVFPHGSQRAEFMRTIAAARKMAQTRRAVQGNSKTAKYLTNAQEAGKGIQTTSDVIAASRGSIPAIGALLERGRNFASGITPGVADEILQLLMQKGGGSASESTSRAIQDASARVLARRALNDRLSRPLLPAPAVVSETLFPSQGQR